MQIRLTPAQCSEFGNACLAWYAETVEKLLSSGETVYKTDRQETERIRKYVREINESGLASIHYSRQAGGYVFDFEVTHSQQFLDSLPPTVRGHYDGFGPAAYEAIQARVNIDDPDQFDALLLSAMVAAQLGGVPPMNLINFCIGNIRNTTSAAGYDGLDDDPNERFWQRLEAQYDAALDRPAGK